jgi:hypothetical protein
MKKNILLLILVLISVSLSATTYYVKANGGSDINDGSSWSFAFASLQPALTAAVKGDSIWVAKGTYMPTKIAGDTPGTDNRDKTFMIGSGITVFGGFAGTETTNYDLSLRDFATNQTILSGNLDGTPANNAYHVVVIVASTGAVTLDGFSVTAGLANGTSYNTIGTKQIQRTYGGGINSLSNSANVYLTNNTIYSNSTTQWGGGIYTLTGTAVGSTYIVKNIIRNNNCAASNGGGLLVETGIVNTISYIANNLIYSNSTTGNGGGVYLRTYGKVYFVNNTISLNTVVGVYSYVPTATASVYVSNCIVYANGSNTIATHSSNLGLTAINDCLLQGGYVAGYNTSSSNIINVNPLFVNSATFDFKLTSSSPAINKGNNTLYDSGLYGSTDLSGNVRTNQSTIDMGAYEGSTTATGLIPSTVSSLVYTNPFTDKFSISGLAGNESIALYDVNGRQLLFRRASGNDLTISTLSLKQGVYFVRIATSGLVRNIKIIKN